MRTRELIACIVLVHGSFGSHALAQGFVRRYDPLGQAGQQVGWGIEQNGTGYVVLGTTTVLTDIGEYYNPVVVAINLDPDGEVIGIDTLIVANHALYPGTWNCMNRRKNGMFISGGGTFSQTETQRFALWKIDQTGFIEMAGHYGIEGQEWIGRQAIECKDGGFLIAGENSEVGVIDAMLIKTDSSGAIEWQKTYGGPLWRDYFVTSDTTVDEGYFVGGSLREGLDNLQFWVVRIDDEGDTLWSSVWGSEYNDGLAFLTTKASGNPVIASGWSYAPEFTWTRCYMAELDQADGSFVWQREYGPYVNFTQLRTAKEAAPGEGHIAAGFDFAENSNFFRGVLLRTADNGDSLWMRSYFYYDSLMTDGMGEFTDVVPTNDGGFIACGYTHGSYTGPYPPGYSQDVWVVKVDSLGCIVPGCDDFNVVITQQITDLKGALAVAPNPVHGSTTVAISLPTSLRDSSPLVLALVSAQGKLIREQQVQQGANALDLADLSGGLYYLHLRTGSTWLAGTKLVVE